ncbi:MAG: class I SAM-dependent methyltransferase [Campylobacterota bacterium]|nr:class I SAM-dependent methyltransferase [Campylobacterota bacterium]
MNQLCPLCGSHEKQLFSEDDDCKYYQCFTCKLVFVPSKYYLNEDEEKQRYDLHTNSPADLNYRKFLNRMFEPIQERFSHKSSGLDFGSGPGPTLSLMFEEAGHKMSIYDYFYANDIDVFTKEYDFITATEVVEHLHQPYDELYRLWSCLKRDGYLGIMTSRYDEVTDFSKWHYKLDPTHICFFSIDSFKWLCKKWQCDLHVIDKDTVILHKKQITD